MPEMPDVEALARFLDAKLRGAQVRGLQLGSFTALKTVDPPVSAAAGAVVGSVGRRGKVLLIHLEPQEPDRDPLLLGVHLYRAGWAAWRERTPATSLRPGKGTIVARLVIDAGACDFTEAGTQRRLALWLGRSETQIEPLGGYGPEALDLATDAQAWGAALKAHPARVKTWLADQHVLAGIGNGFSDDILHRARLSPFAATDKLTRAAAEQLREATTSVLLAATEVLSGLPLTKMKAAKKAHYAIHGRDGEPCPTCGETIRSVNYATSSFQYCPGCQTKGKPLADRTTSRFVK